MDKKGQPPQDSSALENLLTKGKEKILAILTKS